MRIVRNCVHCLIGYCLVCIDSFDVSNSDLFVCSYFARMSILFGNTFQVSVCHAVLKCLNVPYYSAFCFCSVINLKRWNRIYFWCWRMGKFFRNNHHRPIWQNSSTQIKWFCCSCYFLIVRLPIYWKAK